MGYFVEDPVIRQIDNNSWLTTFDLGVIRHFKKANGMKSKETTVLSMQAWDSGAIKIADDFIQNDFVIVECTAKNSDGSKIVFRVNKFYPITHMMDSE
jgi:single-stranded DNA-binding protein